MLHKLQSDVAHDGMVTLSSKHKTTLRTQWRLFLEIFIRLTQS